MNRKTLIFDFDGTLADSFDFVTSFLAEKAGKEMTPEMRRRLGGMSMRGMARELEIPKRRFLSLFVGGRRAMGRRMEEIKPVPGIEDMLRDLQDGDDGYKFLVLSSNRKKNVQLFLKNNNLGQYFSDVKGNASLLGKARGLRAMLQRNGLEPEDCVYIGDEVGDLKAAHNVGVIAVGAAFPEGYNSEEMLAAEHPAAIARDPAELLEILRNL